MREIKTIPAEEYFAIDAVSCSLLKRMDCPAKAHISKPPSAAMDLGTVVHALVLEPDADLIAVAPEINRRTKAGKEEWAEFQKANSGKLILDQATFEQACCMRDSVLAHAAASGLLRDGKPEQSVFWNDEHTAEPCKARIDWLRNDNVIVDLKTARCAAPGAFAKACADLKYHWQDAFYTDAVEAPAFFFVVVESEEPYLTEVYQLTDDARELGRACYRQALDEYHACKMFDSWPGYNGEDKITMLDLPAWAYK